MVEYPYSILNRAIHSVPGDLIFESMLSDDVEYHYKGGNRSYTLKELGEIICEAEWEFREEKDDCHVFLERLCYDEDEGILFAIWGS